MSMNTTYFLESPMGFLFKKEDGKYYSWHKDVGKWVEYPECRYYFSGMEDGRFITEEEALKLTEGK